MTVIKHKNLYEALGIEIEKKNIISFVGGGGKTSSIYCLGEELKKLGKKVIVITTTKMYRPNTCGVYVNDIEEIQKTLENELLITVGLLDRDNKIKFVGDETAIMLANICDILLIEADGARMKPIKVPAEHEPVILINSNLVVGIAGIDAVGRTLEEVCHRADLASQILNITKNDIVNERHIARILASKDGQMKYLYNNKIIMAQYKVIINKVDNAELLSKAIIISKELKKNGINSVMTSIINRSFYSNINY